MNSVEFQALDWKGEDLELDNDDSDYDDSKSESSDDSDYKTHIKKNTHRRFLIKVFGVDDDGNSVSTNITGFTPYFWIKPNKPQKMSSMDISRIEDALRHKRCGKFVSQTEREYHIIN